MYPYISTKHLLGLMLAVVSLTACNSSDEDDDEPSEKPSFTVTATASGGEALTPQA